ncbi:MAG: diacylglycerol kinase family protein [Gaiellaceae bacterium]
MTRATLIVNPYASRVDEARLAAVVRALGDVEVLRTVGPGHATELARAVGAGTIWVLGGDGTFNEVLNGARPDAELGIVPGGRTNVLARALGPGTRRRISVGRVNGRRFGFAAGVGFDAELLRRAGRGRSDLGMAVTAARILLERRGRFEPALDIAGFGEAAFALVANADPYTYVGRLGIHVARPARFDLGLDLVAPPRLGLRDYPAVLRYLLSGRGGLLRGHDLDRIVITCREPLPLQADGEDLGDVTEAVFEAERDAVTILVG